MACCEKCWSDSGGDLRRYYELLGERMENPCSPREQAGPYWDTERGIDTRFEKPSSQVSDEEQAK